MPTGCHGSHNTNSEGLRNMIYFMFKSFSVGGQDFGAVGESSDNTCFPKAGDWRS